MQLVKALLVFYFFLFCFGGGEGREGKGREKGERQQWCKVKTFTWLSSEIEGYTNDFSSEEALQAPQLICYCERWVKN